MKMLKKNQMIIVVIALMLMAAGYLNYTANENFIPTSTISDVGNTQQYAGIGDATFVSGNTIQENVASNAKSNTPSNVIANTAITQEGSGSSSENTMVNTINQTQTNIIENTVSTSANMNKQNNYFVSSRLGRDTMYSQMIESYQKVLENQNISNEQKSIAGEEIKKINESKNAIMICENLIKTKGFEDCIIFVNDKSINIIIKAEKLEQDQIAQIQNIVSREMKAQIEDIHISHK